MRHGDAVFDTKRANHRLVADEYRQVIHQVASSGNLQTEVNAFPPFVVLIVIVTARVE